MLGKDYSGSTPGKKSRTGREVIDRMKTQGKVRRNPLTGKDEVFGKIRTPDGTVRDGWFNMSKADMGHSPIDAVDYWNSTGINYGPKSPEVRNWMLNPNNYELQHFSYNRSMGGSTNSTYNIPPGME